MTSFQNQSLFTNQFNPKNHYDEDEDDDSACSSKENFLPVNYYSETGSTTNLNHEIDYHPISNGGYPNTPMQSNEHFSYSSMIQFSSLRTDLYLPISDVYNSYYQSFAPPAMPDYDNTIRYNTNPGFIPYDSSYLTYPSTPLMSANFSYINDHYPSNQ